MRDDDETTLPGEASITTERAESGDEDPTAKAEREATEKKLKTARKQFRTIVEATSFFRGQAKLDIQFTAGTWGDKSFQWPVGVQEDRIAEQRPCITINRMPGFIRQVTNIARQARLRIQVSPVDDKSDPKIAEVLQSCVRHVEVESWADRVYAAASNNQATIGLGFLGLTVEWADDETFKRKIRMERKTNPLAIYVDPAAREADWSDADYAFEVFDLDEEAYELHTGEKAPEPGDSTFASDGDATGDWFPNGKIRIAKWYNREPVGEKKHIALMSDGAVIPYPTAEQEKEINALGRKVKQGRYVQKRQMVMRKITGVKILEKSVWPAKAQPYIPVLGDELEVEGVKDWRGIPRDSKGGGQAYNVQVSGLIEGIGQGLRSPAVGYRGQFGAPNTPQRRAWEMANRKPVAFLEVEELTIDGVRAPIPQRVSYTPEIQSHIAGIQQTDEDLKSTAGFRDASMGERGPQESGKAILARQKQDELGSSHYLDNLRFAMCSLGRQMIQLIRVFYDEPTVRRITGKDEREYKAVVFAGADKDPRNPEFLATHPEGAAPLTMKDGSVVQPGQKIPYQLPEGVTEIFDLSVGEFDVEVNAQQDSGTRRQEAVEAISALFQKLPPEIATKFLDLYFMVMDFPMARQMAERAKKMLPPEMQDDDEGGQPMPPQAVAQLQALQQELQQASQALQAAQQELGTQSQQLQMKERMFQLEQSVKERLAQAELQAKAQADAADIQRQREKDQLDAQMLEKKNQAEIEAEIYKAQITTKIKMDGELRLQGMKNESARELAEIQARAQARRPRQVTLKKDANGETIGADVREIDEIAPQEGASV